MLASAEMLTVGTVIPTFYLLSTDELIAKSDGYPGISVNQAVPDIVGGIDPKV